MNAGSVAEIKAYVVNITVAVIIVAKNVAYCNILGRYSTSQDCNLCSIMRKSDAVVISIDIGYESGTVKS